MVWSVPRTYVAGEIITAAILNVHVRDQLQVLDPGQAQTLLYTPPGNLDTTTTAAWVTWMTIGTVTVPAWATRASVVYSVIGCYSLATGINALLRMQIGAAAGGVSKRILEGASPNRFTIPVADKFTGLTSGVQSVTLAAYYVAGPVTSYRTDATSNVTAQFTFQP